MTAPPRVSVVLPVRNVAPYVASALCSLLEQTFRDFEVVVIDDGSTDATVDEVVRVADHRVVLLRNPQPTGDLGETLNLGLEAARGEYVARMDGDDLSYPGRLEAQVAALDADPELGLVGTWNDMIDEDGNLLMQSMPPYTDGAIRFVLHYQNTFHHPSAMFRAAVADQVGRYASGKQFAEDYDLWERIAQVSRVANLPHLLGAQRVRGSSVSALYPAGQTAVADEVGVRMFTRSIGRAPTLETLHRLRDGHGPQSTSAEACDVLVALHRALLASRPAGDHEAITTAAYEKLSSLWQASRGRARLRPWAAAVRLRPAAGLRLTAKTLVRPDR